MYSPVQIPRCLCTVLQYMPAVLYHLHTLFWYRNTYMTLSPPGNNPDIPKQLFDLRSTFTFPAYCIYRLNRNA